MEDRLPERIDPYDHPSLIFTPINNPVGDPNGDKFIEILRAYLWLDPTDEVPVIRVASGAIDLPATLAMTVYDHFPDKEKWLGR